MFSREQRFVELVMNDGLNFRHIIRNIDIFSEKDSIELKERNY
jgi:hypothetical protein